MNKTVVKSYNTPCTIYILGHGYSWNNDAVIKDAKEFLLESKDDVYLYCLSNGYIRILSESELRKVIKDALIKEYLLNSDISLIKVENFVGDITFTEEDGSMDVLSIGKNFDYKEFDNDSHKLEDFVK